MCWEGDCLGICEENMQKHCIFHHPHFTLWESPFGCFWPVSNCKHNTFLSSVSHSIEWPNLKRLGNSCKDRQLVRSLGGVEMPAEQLASEVMAVLWRTEPEVCRVQCQLQVVDVRVVVQYAQLGDENGIVERSLLALVFNNTLHW